MDESEETGASPEAPEARPDLVRMGLILYGVMMAAALVWRVGVYGEPIFHASAEDAARGVEWGRDVLLGLAVGLAIVGLSAVATALTDWGDALARALADSLGGLRVPDALLLAVASGLGEELFFRGALQPRVGWVWASLIFGVVHFIPQRAFLPWTGFAIGCGFVLGALFSWTGNLVAPVTAHVVINGINLPRLARQSAEQAAPRPR